MLSKYFHVLVWTYHKKYSVYVKIFLKSTQFLNLDSTKVSSYRFYIEILKTYINRKQQNENDKNNNLSSVIIFIHIYISTKKINKLSQLQ